MTLREAWTSHIAPEDYDQHMASIGQAQANAALVHDLFVADPPAPGSRVLIAGAGTGQIFDFLPAGFFDQYTLTCSDLSEQLLARLRTRVDCETVVDDIESSRLTPGFGAIIVVLVLEHVDWRKAIRNIAALDSQRLMIVIQSNPSDMPTAVTPGRTLPATMQVFAEEAHPVLVPEQDLIAAVGLPVKMRLEREVADNKRMIGLLF